MNKEKQLHWENVYKAKQPFEMSWTQAKPQTSLEFIHSFNLDKKASIIDIGGGDSRLVDNLLDEGYENITVLDISSAALESAKLRLGKKAEQVKWILSDVVDFEPNTKYDLWHDRATFHFLTTDEDIKKYLTIVERAVSGYLMIATFSDTGPSKCSGLDIKRYNEEQLTQKFSNTFYKIRCLTEDHLTPFNTSQNFIFCGFKRIDSFKNR
jgi:ubiquinone/menaquinone biosynthesis C-methylase UbiE